MRSVTNRKGFCPRYSYQGRVRSRPAWPGERVEHFPLSLVSRFTLGDLGRDGGLELVILVGLAGLGLFFPSKSFWTSAGWYSSALGSGALYQKMRGQEPPHERHHQDAEGGDEELARVQGDLETTEDFRPRVGRCES